MTTPPLVLPDPHDQEVSTRLGVNRAGTANPAAVYLARLAPGSRRTMRGALDRIAAIALPGATAKTFPWARLRYEHCQAIRAHLAESSAPSTANKCLAALRGTLKEAWRLQQMTAEDYRRAADVPGVRGTLAPKGRALAGEELAALLRVCMADASPAGRRDAALIALLYATGLRRAEAAALSLADLGPEGEVLVRTGKGRKARTVYLNAHAASLVTAWREQRGPNAGPLFLAVRRGGHLVLNRHLTPQSVLDILRRRGNQAGLAPFSPHDLRRTHISDLLDAGVDLVTVQNLAGHANVATTGRYDRRGERAKRKAAAALPF